MLCAVDTYGRCITLSASVADGTARWAGPLLDATTTDAFPRFGSCLVAGWPPPAALGKYSDRLVSRYPVDKPARAPSCSALSTPTAGV